MRIFQHREHIDAGSGFCMVSSLEIEFELFKSGIMVVFNVVVNHEESESIERTQSQKGSEQPLYCYVWFFVT